MAFVFLLLVTLCIYAETIPRYRENVKIPDEIAKITAPSEIKKYFDQGTEIRIAAARRLGQIGGDESVELLKWAFGKEPYRIGREMIPHVKIEIIESLKAINSEKSKSCLIEILLGYLKTGPKVKEKDFIDDGDYFGVIANASKALYQLYDPKKDDEIYNLFENIALHKNRKWWVELDDRLRTSAYAVYLKRDMAQKSITDQKKVIE